MSVQQDQPSFKDRSDVYAFNVRNEQMIREYQIAIENQAIIRERLAHCARTEGVNQYVACKELREKYMEICNDRFKGMLFPEGSEPLNRVTPGMVITKKAE